MRRKLLLSVIAAGMMALPLCGQNLSVNYRSKTIDQVISDLESKTNYTFVYQKNEVSDVPPVTLSLRNASLPDVLNHICAGSGLTYEIVKETIILKKFVADQTAAPAWLKGRVVDERGDPLLGAVVKAGDKSATTDYDGHFTVDSRGVPFINVYYIGYKDALVSVQGQNNLVVAMEPSNEYLEEAVAIGYGTIKKRDLTGAIASVSSEEIAVKSPTNVFQALQGSSAGVSVVSYGSAPGDVPVIRVRGISTMGDGTVPLYVVDGIPMENIDQLNPEDVASMEVLKDAASAAIYGSRAANGVILITTKHGVEGHPQFDVKYKHSFGKVAYMMLPTTPQAFREYQQAYHDARGMWELEEDPTGWTDPLRWYVNQDGNQMKDVLRTAQRDEINISMAAAKDKFDYFVGGNYLDERGVILNSRYRRFTTRMNASYEVTPWLSVGSNFQFGVSDVDGVSASEIMRYLGRWTNWLGIYDAEGNINPSSGTRMSALARVTYQLNDYLAFNGTESVWLEARLADHWKIRSNVSGYYRLQQRDFFTPSILLTGNLTGHTDGQRTHDLQYNILNENYISWENQFGSHSVSVMGGTSLQYWVSDYLVVHGYDYTNDLIWTVNNATTFNSGENYSSRSEHSLASFFGRATYDYAGKYLLTGTLRYDGSSRFGKNRRWGFFPSASAGWRFSDEPFFEWAKPALTDAKIRASYGVTGNQEIGNYTAIPRLSATSKYDGLGGFAPTLTYANLSWEETRQKDLGLDLSLFNSRLNLVLDWYIKDTDGLLSDLNVPAETGFSSLTLNYGGMRNKGVELTIGLRPIQTRDWFWEVNFNISHNNAVYSSLPDHEGYTTVETNSCIRVQEGLRVGEFWGMAHDGIFQYDESNAFDDDWNQLTPVFNASGGFDHYELDGAVYTGNINKKKQGSTVLVGGDVNWLENPDSQDGSIDWTADKVYLGCLQPDFYGGLNSTLAWKGLSLNVTFNYSFGNEIYNYAARSRSGYETTWASLPTDYVIAHSWKKPGDVAEYPIINPNRSVNKRSVSDFWIEDGSYIRLSSARLSYDLPDKWIRKVRMKSASLYCYGTNLLTWTNYSGNNPDCGIPSYFGQGIDNGTYPAMREFGLGLNVTF